MGISHFSWTGYLDAQAAKLRAAEQKSQQLFLRWQHLKLKASQEMALSVIYSLAMNVKNKDILPQKHVATFDFMVDHLIGSLYE